MPAVDCRVADVDLASLGWVLSRVDGLRAVPRVTPAHRAGPGRYGLIRTGRRTTDARTITLTGIIVGGTAAAIESVRDAVIRLAGTGPVRIETALRPGVAWTGELVSDQVTEFGPQLLATDPTHTLTFACANPVGYDTDTRVVGWTGATDPAVIECGTAPSDLTVRVIGPATNPDVRLCNARGDVVGQISLNVTLAAADWLVVSAETFRVTVVRSGVEADAPEILAPGSRFLSVDPGYDADPGAGAWPYVYSTSGTGQVVYRRAWL